MAKAKDKPQTPTLAELEEAERVCRENLMRTLDDPYSDCVVDLPAIDADEEEFCHAECCVEEPMQHAHDILADAHSWVEAFEAVRAARTTVKAKAA